VAETDRYDEDGDDGEEYEGETSTQPDRSSSEGDDDDHADDVVLIGRLSPVSLQASRNASVKHRPSTLTRRPTLMSSAPPALNGANAHANNNNKTESTARQFLNEKLRQRLEEKRRRGALPEAQARTTPTADDDDHAPRGAWGDPRRSGTSGRSRTSGAGKLSTAQGRRGVATRKELDIWEQLMLTSVIQPLLPSPSSGAATTTTTANTSHSSARSPSPSRPSRQEHYQHQHQHQHQQPAAPVTCACEFGGHEHQLHTDAPALPHYSCPLGSARGSSVSSPPTATVYGSGVTSSSSSSSFPGTFPDDDLLSSWYRRSRATAELRGEEERKRKREQKNESEDGYYQDRARLRYEPVQADDYYNTHYYYDHLYPAGYYPPAEPVYEAARPRHYHDLPRHYPSDSSKRRRGHSPASSDSALMFHHFAAVDSRPRPLEG
jgi:hypothetical protein